MPRGHCSSGAQRARNVQNRTAQELRMRWGPDTSSNQQSEQARQVRLAKQKQLALIREKEQFIKQQQFRKQKQRQLLQNKRLQEQRIQQKVDAKLAQERKALKAEKDQLAKQTADLKKEQQKWEEKSVDSQSTSYENRRKQEAMYMCSITAALMENPVQTPCCHRFQKEAIVQYLGKKSTCPLCQQPLGINQLRDDHFVKELIQQFKLKELKTEMKKARLE